MALRGIETNEASRFVDHTQATPWETLVADIERALKHISKPGGSSQTKVTYLDQVYLVEKRKRSAFKSHDLSKCVSPTPAYLANCKWYITFSHASNSPDAYDSASKTAVLSALTVAAKGLYILSVPVIFAFTFLTDELEKIPKLSVHLSTKINEQTSNDGYVISSVFYDVSSCQIHDKHPLHFLDALKRIYEQKLLRSHCVDNSISIAECSNVTTTSSFLCTSQEWTPAIIDKMLMSNEKEASGTLRKYSYAESFYSLITNLAQAHNIRAPRLEQILVKLRYQEQKLYSVVDNGNYSTLVPSKQPAHCWTIATHFVDGEQQQQEQQQQHRQASASSSASSPRTTTTGEPNIRTMDNVDNRPSYKWMSACFRKLLTFYIFGAYGKGVNTMSIEKLGLEGFNLSDLFDPSTLKCIVENLSISSRMAFFSGCNLKHNDSVDEKHSKSKKDVKTVAPPSSEIGGSRSASTTASAAAVTTFAGVEDIFDTLLPLEDPKVTGSEHNVREVSIIAGQDHNSEIHPEAAENYSVISALTQEQIKQVIAYMFSLPYGRCATNATGTASAASENRVPEPEYGAASALFQSDNENENEGDDDDTTMLVRDDHHSQHRSDDPMHSSHAVCSALECEHHTHTHTPESDHQHRHCFDDATGNWLGVLSLLSGSLNGHVGGIGSLWVLMLREIRESCWENTHLLNRFCSPNDVLTAFQRRRCSGGGNVHNTVMRNDVSLPLYHRLLWYDVVNRPRAPGSFSLSWPNALSSVVAQKFQLIQFCLQTRHESKFIRKTSVVTSGSNDAHLVADTSTVEGIVEPLLCRRLPLTGDTVYMHKHIERKLDSSTSSTVRANPSIKWQVQIPSLVSDIKAFKSDNPTATFRQFCIWYGFDLLPQKGSNLGSVDLPILCPDATLEELWNSCEGIPALEQKPLFHAEKEMEKSLAYLESLSVAQCATELLLNALNLIYDILAVKLTRWTEEASSEHAVGPAEAHIDSPRAYGFLIKQDLQMLWDEIVLIREHQQQLMRENSKPVGTTSSSQAATTARGPSTTTAPGGGGGGGGGGSCAPPQVALLSHLDVAANLIDRLETFVSKAEQIDFVLRHLGGNRSTSMATMGVVQSSTGHSAADLYHDLSRRSFTSGSISAVSSSNMRHGTTTNTVSAEEMAANADMNNLVKELACTVPGSEHVLQCENDVLNVFEFIKCVSRANKPDIGSKQSATAQRLNSVDTLGWTSFDGRELTYPTCNSFTLSLKQPSFSSSNTVPTWQDSNKESTQEEEVVEENELLPPDSAAKVVIGSDSQTRDADNTGKTTTTSSSSTSLSLNKGALILTSRSAADDPRNKNPSRPNFSMNAVIENNLLKVTFQIPSMHA